MESNLKNKMTFDHIRYSLVWEDPRLLLNTSNSLQSKKEKSPTPSIALSIASSGDNALALLTHFDKVVAIDLSPAQISLVELKKASIESHSFSEHCELMGYQHSSRRQTLYQGLQASLNSDSRDFWGQNRDILMNGIAHNGRLESYFQKFRQGVFNKLWTSENLQKMCHTTRLEEQINLWQHSHIETVRTSAAEFFSQAAMEGVARDSAQFAYVQKINIGQKFVQKFEKLIETQLISQNPFLYHFITGDFLLNQFDIPERNPETYGVIKGKIQNLQPLKADLESYLSDEGTPAFDFFNLSDIFEYMSEEHCQKTFSSLAQKSHPNSQLAYWSLLVPREYSGESWKKNNGKSQSLSQQDRLWLYSNFTVLEK